MQVRIFEERPVKTRADWLKLKERFRLSIEGRFPKDWAQRCEHSRTAEHPVDLLLRGPSKAAWAALGLEGKTGLFPGVNDRHWRVWFSWVELGVFDSARYRLLTASEVRRAGLERASVRASSFRCAPGTGPDG